MKIELSKLKHRLGLKLIGTAVILLGFAGILQLMIRPNIINVCEYNSKAVTISLIDDAINERLVDLGENADYGNLVKLSYTSDGRCPPYTAAKHGVIGITRNFSNELGRYNIQTNAICPGFLATEVNAELRKDPAFYDKITNRIAAGRWGELDDLMGTMVFLASRASDYLNGVDINVDGGFFTVL